jgi:hypothetical protein
LGQNWLQIRIQRLKTSEKQLPVLLLARLFTRKERLWMGQPVYSEEQIENSLINSHHGLAMRVIQHLAVLFLFLYCLVGYCE